MNNRIDHALMKEILNCTKCRKSSALRKYFPNDCPPVCCFGDPIDKKTFVVGINPLKAEYDSGYLESNIEKALESQIKYFERREYKFFNEIARFFDNPEIKAKLRFTNSIWEKVGYLDLVKCVTAASKDEQWNGLKISAKKKTIENCQGFLERQLGLYQPKLIVAYGKDVGMWFGVKDSGSEEFGLISYPRKLGFKYHAIYVSQRQGKHSRPEVNEIRAKIKEVLN